MVATSPDSVSGQLRDLKPAKIAAVAARFRVTVSLADPDNAAQWSRRQLARRYPALTDEPAETDTKPAAAAAVAAPTRLLEQPGIRAGVASAIVTAVGDNPERMLTEATFVPLAGTSPGGRREREAPPVTRIVVVKHDL